MIYSTEAERDKAFDLLYPSHVTDSEWGEHLEKRVSKSESGTISVRGDRRVYRGRYFMVMKYPGYGDFAHSPEWKILLENKCTGVADPLIEYKEILEWTVEG